MSLNVPPLTTPNSPNNLDGGTTAATVSQSLSKTSAGCTPGSAKPSERALQSVTLPWPPKALSPNARVHHMALAKAKKAYKEACMWQAKADGAKPMTGALHLTITFVPPDRRHRDLDNMLASIKSGLDGLRDVLGVDDSRWSLTIRKTPHIGGVVLVEVANA